MQYTLWAIYRNGETVGMIRARLAIATATRQAGCSRTLIHQLTQFP
jgi:hypothetical protein